MSLKCRYYVQNRNAIAIYFIGDMFVKKSYVHNYPTRHAHNLCVTSNHKSKLSEQFITEPLLYQYGIMYLLILIPSVQYVTSNIK